MKKFFHFARSLDNEFDRYHLKSDFVTIQESSHMAFFGKKITIIGIIICVAILAAYVAFRASTLESTYISYLSRKVSGLQTSFNNYFMQRDLSTETLSNFLKKATVENSDLALIAIKGEDTRVLLLSSNNQLLADSSVYDEMVDEIYANKFTAKTGITHVIRYYNSQKYYLFVTNCNTGSITAVFPRRLPFPFLIRLLVEVIAVAAGTVIILTLLMIYLSTWLTKRKNRIQTEPIEKTESNEPPQLKSEKPANKQRSSGDAAIFEILSEIAEEIKSTNVSYSAIDMIAMKIRRQYRFTDGKFTSTKSPRASTIDTRKELIAEVAKGSPVIRDKGRQIIMPVIARKVLYGFVSVVRSKKFSGTEVTLIKRIASGLAEVK
jgi:hypothetical protein